MKLVVNGRGRSACTMTGKVGGHVETRRGEVDQGVQLCTGVPNLEIEGEGEERVDCFLTLELLCTNPLSAMYMHWGLESRLFG